MKAAVLKKEGSDDDAGSGDGVARAGPGPGRDRNAVMSASARAGRRVGLESRREGWCRKAEGDLSR